MNNQLKYLVIFLGILIVAALVMYFLNNPGTTGRAILDSANDGSTINSSDMFSSVQKLHWTEMPVTYKFNDNNCGERQRNRIIRAFEEIKNETNGIVYFVEDNNAVLEINCIKGFPADDKGYVTSGEGGNTKLGNQITSGTINFYNAGPNTDSGGCSVFMDVEIHEILHTFGYTHSEGYGSIMQPISPGWCNVRQIDDWIVKDLIQTYS